jgi:hypothetical protein
MMPHSVTLSCSEGLSAPWAERCFAAAQHDMMVTPAAGSSCLQQGTGPRPHPRRVIMKITPTGHRARACLHGFG